MENRNDWHEKGEYPPIGTVCQIKPFWIKVKITCYDEAKEGVRAVFWDYNQDRYDYVIGPDFFRPFKSDKEEWVQAIFKITYAHKSFRHIFGELYDLMKSGKLPTP